ncbi:MAG: riboflavin synthase [Bacteroidia bacterium]|nr:riboflavin synthase [Bacteroidia bacterium]
MFTGIIETTGIVTGIEKEESNVHFSLTSIFTHELKIDQSVAHNGVCLTVVAINGNAFKVTAVAETLSKTNLNQLKVGSAVNLERCMLANGRFDGHIVQGHIDDTAMCTSVEDKNGSWLFHFRLNQQEQRKLVVNKGSICINGVSLTVVEINDLNFYVTIIPYTYKYTQFNELKKGDLVNIEFDILGKYVLKQMEHLK